MSIETELFKEVNNNWVSQGAATAAQVNQTTFVWSNLRYNNLAVGKYKVVATLKYNQTNPMPPTNPKSVSDPFEGTFN